MNTETNEMLFRPLAKLELGFGTTPEDWDFDPEPQHGLLEYYYKTEYVDGVSRRVEHVNNEGTFQSRMTSPGWYSLTVGDANLRLTYPSYLKARESSEWKLVYDDMLSRFAFQQSNFDNSIEMLNFNSTYYLVNQFKNMTQVSLEEYLTDMYDVTHTAQLAILDAYGMFTTGELPDVDSTFELLSVETSPYNAKGSASLACRLVKYCSSYFVEYCLHDDDDSDPTLKAIRRDTSEISF